MESSETLIGAAQDAKKRCEALKDRIEGLRTQSSSSPTSNWKTTLLRLVHSELSFLNRFLISASLNNNRQSSLSVNVGHLESVVHILELPSISGISRVCMSIPLVSSQEKLRPNAASCLKSIYVDIMCCLEGSPVWFIVSDRNPKYISWEWSSGNKGLRNRVEEVLEAARSSETLRPSSVIFFFSKGLEDVVYEKLQHEFGAADLRLTFPCFDCSFCEESEDDWINVLLRSYEEACVLKLEIKDQSKYQNLTSTTGCIIRQTLRDLPLPEENIQGTPTLGESLCSLISGLKCCLLDVELNLLKTMCNGHSLQLVNFDTTALIAIVSGISNGGMNKLLATSESKLRSQFKSNYEFVIAQVNSEIQNPIHKELSASTSGKGGIICESVHSEFQELVSMCGGPNEKIRANYILKHLRMVPDCPSSRLASLPTTRKLALKNKVVFGTGDYWHAPTLSANMAFVRAVSQTGMSLFTIQHRPRALIGD
ncbi:UPF0415 protein C7orf25 homolog [Coffea eugenioides]|uniref:DUF1308 domain-containing protein n=1 Tax=Coffea arabica TaxID=13443 RepID=A0ABM4U9I7_COFAR|nr:UPF0415 protein C7orf25 homolog [Coffea eugenioides]